jgi:hypothetical protein
MRALFDGITQAVQGNIGQVAATPDNYILLQ